MTPATICVIIPSRGYSENLRSAILSVTQTNVSEIIVVSRTAINLSSIASDERVKLIVELDAGLSEARNRGISESSAEIVAFTDDDCTVPKDWPVRALELFRNVQVGVVGGPGVTNPDDSWQSKCAGAVLSTRLGTATSIYRYAAVSDLPRPAGEQELSTCNLFFRRSVLEDVGYFEPSLKTCEENELIERISSAGYLVLYAPACVVFHQRRPLFRPFLIQISNYAKGRAAFSLKWPRRLKYLYLVPSILVLLTVMIPVLSIFSLQLANTLAAILAVYLLTMALAATTSTAKNGLKLRYAPLVFLGIITMHYCYGISFLAGLYKSARTRY